MSGACEMYLLATQDRCGEPAVFHVEHKRPEVKAVESGDGFFCMAHAVQLAAYFLPDGRPEYRITALEAMRLKAAANEVLKLAALRQAQAPITLQEISDILTIALFAEEPA